MQLSLKYVKCTYILKITSDCTSGLYGVFMIMMGNYLTVHSVDIMIVFF